MKDEETPQEEIGGEILFDDMFPSQIDLPDHFVDQEIKERWRPRILQKTYKTEDLELQYPNFEKLVTPRWDLFEELEEYKKTDVKKAWEIRKLIVL